MAEDKPSVCVSFTPRDEAAALRVASALREAGVEVVLSSEGGSEVLEACDLFLPIISSNTQSEASGRFRNEWQRAAQRADAMRDDTTFLLPVVVDDTANREAKVPEVFRGRAWLRFDVWGSSTPLVSRVEAMLERRSIVQAEAAAAQRAAAEEQAKSWVKRWIKRLPPWVRRLRIVWIISLVVVAGGAIVWRLSNPPGGSVEEENHGIDIPTVPVSDASADAEVAADPAADRNVAQPRVERASDSAIVGASTSYPTNGHTVPAERNLNAPLVSHEERSDGPLRKWKAQPVVTRASAGPSPTGVSQTVLAQEVWAAPVDASADVGRAMAEALPASRSDENSVGNATLTGALIALWQGKPGEAAADVERIDDDWIDCAVFTGPPALLLGLCQVAQQGPDAGADLNGQARVTWLRALETVQARRLSRPDEARLALVEAQVLVLLGRETAALDALQVYDDSAEGQATGPQREHLIVWATLGDYTALMNEIVARFRDGKQRWAEVHNWLRYDPRFAAWRERMAASRPTSLN